MSITDVACGRMPQAPGWPVNRHGTPDPASSPERKTASVRRTIRTLFAPMRTFSRRRRVRPRLDRPWNAAFNTLVYAEAGATFRRLIPYLGALASLAFIAVYLFQALPTLMDIKPEP